MNRHFIYDHVNFQGELSVDTTMDITLLIESLIQARMAGVTHIEIVSYEDGCDINYQKQRVENDQEYQARMERVDKRRKLAENLERTTLFSLLQKYGMPTKEEMELNNIKPEEVFSRINPKPDDFPK